MGGITSKCCTKENDISNFNFQTESKNKVEEGKFI